MLPQGFNERQTRAMIENVLFIVDDDLRFSWTERSSHVKSAEVYIQPKKTQDLHLSAHFQQANTHLRSSLHILHRTWNYVIRKSRSRDLQIYGQST